MAKWGKGDPRWIVEERADATNVNNWHWTERDATNWSSEKLKELLLGVRVENEDGSCEVTEVSQVEGEASINNRKGKLIFFYEWNLKMTWTGTAKSGIKYKGTVEISNLSDENDMDDLDIAVSLGKDEPETDLTALMKKEGAKKIRETMGMYMDALRTEFTQGMILPTINDLSKDAGAQPTPKVDKAQPASGNAASKTSAGVKIPTCRFILKDHFPAPPEEIYRVFVTQELVQGFTHSAAVVDAEKGGKFKLLEGNVTGEFLELVPEQKIGMKWRFKTWPTEHYANITIHFVDQSGETELKVDCKGVPVNEEDRTKDGWKRYYFEGIKQTFGYGARLY
ncbi:activator of 90 kDa heat shock protein ATPase homolog 1-like [Polyodon spathula]|uniref:activator of 90 kDa heat shock protein ATPase homolog 1-like n=1 Tax=Polyodon spathula TaxID=7913 RepID=UPI001B7DA827|nr:activator of 90 kDa heat shock protein ATPase homolog 1-like [Polyodon spathula]